MEDAPQEFRFHQEIDEIRGLVESLRRCQNVIASRPWLAPMLGRVLPENGITERTFHEFTAIGIKGLCETFLTPDDHAAPTP